MEHINSLKYHLLNGIDHLKKKGLISFINQLLIYLGFVYSDKSLIFLECDMETLSTKKIKDYSFKQLKADDIQSGRYNYEDCFFNTRKAVFRIKSGHSLYVVTNDEGQIVTSVWIERQGASIWWLDNLPVDMPEDMVLFSAEYTPPAFRNRAIAPKMLMELLHFLKQNGINRALAVVHPDNDISLRMQRWLGFKDYQVIRYRRFWLFKYYKIFKIDSTESKRVLVFFKSPKEIWNTYLPYGHYN